MEKDAIRPIVDIQEIIRIAKKAGEAIMGLYGREYQTTLKEDQSPVTAADLAANEVIEREIMKLWPDIPYISEEVKPPPYEERSGWDRFWLVDPLDGTKEFIRNKGEFTVNIALIEKEVPITGVIYAPAKDIVYYSSRNAGAWKQEGENEPQRIQAKQGAGKEGVIALQSRSHPSKRYNAFLDRLNIEKRVAMGSVLKVCAIAEGEADLFLRMNPTYEWDLAPGQCILEEAGGAVRDLHWEPIKYNKPSLRNDNFIVLSGVYKDPQFAESIKSVLRGLSESM
jgi:3'(2'), 5'-bisphosphate nucleotidase